MHDNRVLAAASVVACIVLLVVAFSIIDHQDFIAMIHAIGTGAMIVFGLLVLFAGAWGAIHLKHSWQVKEIGPNKYGYKQAVIHKGTLIQLNAPMVATPQGNQITTQVKEIIQAAELMARYSRHLPEPDQQVVSGTADVLPLAGPSPQLRLSQAVTHLQRNRLQVYWGTKEDGSHCIIDIPSATHTQKSGGTGLGKSYLTTAELYQLHLLNDADVVQFAYFDLECETTEPFHGMPHVWQYAERTGGQQVTYKAIATEIDHVLPVFEAIDTELRYRDKHKREEFPYLLVVIEEAEELREAVEELPKAEQKTILRLWKRIARRGRKRKILLDINVQNTYTDPILRAAQRQFQLKITAAQQPSTAQAGGFQSLDLLKRLFMAKKKGMFVVSHETGEYIIFAPLIDVDLPDPDDKEDGRIVGDVGRVVEEAPNAHSLARPQWEQQMQKPEEIQLPAGERQRTTGELGTLPDGLVEQLGGSPESRPSYPIMDATQEAQFLALYPLHGLEKSLDQIKGCNHRHRDHARELIRKHNLQRKKS